MARKKALLRLTSGDKIPKEWRWQIDSLKRFTPVEGTEDQYERFVTAVAERMKQDGRFQQACDLHDEHDSPESRALMKDESVALDRAIRREMQMLDAWRSTVKHLHDKVGVPEAEIRNVVLASLSDKIEEIDFSLNSGLLGSKVAQAIRHEATEAEIDTPLCAEHSL